MNNYCYCFREHGKYYWNCDCIYDSFAQADFIGNQLYGKKENVENTMLTSVNKYLPDCLKEIVLNNDLSEVRLK